MKSIYLDNNSTTLIDPGVSRVIIQCYDDGLYNPASQHRPGQAARRHLEQCRQDLLDRLGAAGDRRLRLVFTGGGTEANNLCLLGLAEASSNASNRPKPRVIVSAIEHPSIMGPAGRLKQLGYDVIALPVDEAGVACVDQLESLLTDQTILVSLMLVNNETGVVQPVQRAVRICAQSEIPVHCDAVQAVGKIPVHFRELGVSAMTVTAHKLHGPRGIGGLLVDESRLPLNPIMHGGFQQLGLRPGTEDVALAAGFSKAVELATENLDDRAAHMRELRDWFESLVRSSCDDVVVNGRGAERAPHTSNLSFPGVNRQALLLAADADGVAISTGSACASGSSEPSPVLRAMGLARDVVEGSIRVSLSAQTTRFEIAEAAERITSAVKRLRRSKSSGNSA